MKVKFLATSAIIAALYIAITMLVAPISFGQLQFRIAEMFNHLVAFNPRYMVGVVLGVFISNFLLSSVGSNRFNFWCRTYDYYIGDFHLHL